MMKTAAAAVAIVSMLGGSGAALPAGAQDVTIPVNIEKLAAKALESVNVTVDGPLLKLASQFLSPNDPEQKQVKDLIGNLKGVYVRSFEFADTGQYSDSDVEAIRSQLQAPVWSKMVTVRSKAGGDNVDVFFKMDKGQIAGLVVIAAEAKELTIVNIVGSINLDQLSKLGGQFGIPKLDVETKQK
jgi:uncharacterized protein DUF4252